MSLQFTVLASGSGGNASLLAAGSFRLLLDIGLGPRQLAKRLSAAGAAWSQIHAVLLTHTHSDHWNERTLDCLQRLRIPLYCHPQHFAGLSACSAAFSALLEKELVRPYEVDQELILTSGLGCRPLRLRHDGGMTCGFRFEASAAVFGQSQALGYAADLGTWEPELAQALSEVDLLALEFNHDLILERNSGRSPHLIARVLGDEGHLSNCQAARLFRAVLESSAPGRLRHLVQLHLSQDCNRPALAVAAAREVLNGTAETLELHTSSQHAPSPTFQVGRGATHASSFPTRPPRQTSSGPRADESWLPGFGPA